MSEREINPNQPFIPNSCKVLIIGTMPPKKAYDGKPDFFFYGSRDSQFWKIIDSIFKTSLYSGQVSKENTADKKCFLEKYKIGLFDIIKETERKIQNALDGNLKNQQVGDLKYIFNYYRDNVKDINAILIPKQLFKDYFTKKWKYPNNFEFAKDHANKIKQIPSFSKRNREAFENKLRDYKELFKACNVCPIV